MKRKSRKRRLMMDFMELRRDTTRFLREFQYLSDRKDGGSWTTPELLPTHPSSPYSN